MGYLFTSESVSEGHPDKVADQISDSILDALLAQDPHSRVACETMVTTGVAVIAGEITSKATIDYNQIARDTLEKIGYTDGAYGIDAATCSVMLSVDKQSPDISQGVTSGAGVTFGTISSYATLERSAEIRSFDMQPAIVSMDSTSPGAEMIWCPPLSNLIFIAS